MSLFRKLLLACLAGVSFAATAAWSAVSITDPTVTNVGTTTVTVVWTTSEVSTPGLEVFSDAAGANAVTSNLGLEYYPIAEGNPAVVNDAAARAGRRSLEVLAMNRRVVSVRVTGLTPGTTYYVRPRTFAENGADNGATLVPLMPATTAQFTSMVTDARMLRIRIPTFAAEGMILLVQGPAGTTPLSAIVGDSAAADVALFSTAHLLDTATGTNALFTTPQSFVIRAIGAGAPTATFTQTINFTGGFGAAKLEAIEALIESPAPLITAHPANKTVATGSSVTFTVAATGTPAPTYTWQRKLAGGATWSPLANDTIYSGVSTATLSIASATLAMSGDQFRTIASNGVPLDAISDPATLTVTASAIAPAITTQPENASVIAGLNATFTVAATGTPEPTYHWQRKAAGGDTWIDLTASSTYSGVGTASLAVVNATLAMTGDQFRVVVTNGVLPNATSNVATLTVTAAAIAPAITTQPVSTSVAVAADATFIVAATGTPTPTYTWQIKLAGGSTWLDVGNTEAYAGATTTTLTVKNVTVAMSGDQFRAIAANGTLPDATSDVATLTVLTPPTITAQPQPVSITAGSAATFTVAAQGTGTLSYRWQRAAAGSVEWQDLFESAVYTNTSTATLTVNGALLAMSGDQFRAVVTDTIGATTSNAVTLTVTQGSAAIALTNLRQDYDGSPRVVTATTAPAGLAVTITYNGSTTPPILPGVYSVAAAIQDPNYAGVATGELVISTTVLVRRAPTIAGGIDGSVQVITPEAMTITGWLSGDILVPGTPEVIVNGTPTFAGTRDSIGAVEPTNYGVTLESTATLRYLTRRVDPLTIPAVAAPPAPTGTRNVSISVAGQTPGDFSTLRNLNLSGSVGQVAVPPGTYGNFTANGSAAFVFGVAGATEPAVYNLQNLSINPLQGTAKLVVVGPVILTVANSVSIYGVVGSPEHPEWLTLNAAAGSVMLNSAGALHGTVVAPHGIVSLSGRSTITGRILADRLNVTINAQVNPAQP